MSLWSFMRRIYRFERSIEDMCFDLYKKRQARKKTSGKQKYLADNISFKDKYKYLYYIIVFSYLQYFAKF